MNYNFSPSINIVRDSDKPLYYLPTTNAKQIFQSIAVNFDSGLHAFTIIGSYGTGKSAFLLAFEKTLKQEQVFFEKVNSSLFELENFQFVHVVGAYRSIVEIVAEAFQIEEKNGKQVLKHIKKQLSKDKCLIITIDEFGKILEYAAKNNPDEELFFIQSLAELANDKNRNLLFVTTLHQNFDAYALGLSDAQRKEWEKVKGRLKELTFNEPVEQLLALAAERINDKYKQTKKTNFPIGLLRIIKKNSLFPLRNELEKNFVEKLYPFEPLSAAALTIALQRYGQNERSLFTFLDTKEYLGLEQYDKTTHPFYNLSCVYDYFNHNYYSSLTSRYNPDYFQWTLIRNTLERVDAGFDENIEETRRIVKSIGLLNTLGSAGAKVNYEFLKSYAENCLNIENIDFILGQLQGQKLIIYRKYLDSYRLFEGSDVDIDEELDKLKKTEDGITNVAYELKKYLSLEYATAKAISYQLGTPRFFSFEFSESPLKTFNGEEIDGFVNLVFSTKDVHQEISAVKNEAIVYAVFEETAQIKEQLFEIKIANQLFEKIDGKDPAKREVQNLKDFRTQQLRVYLMQALFEGTNQVSWFFNGEKIDITSRTAFNKFLSTVCKTIYHKTPTFRNELMNRHKLSGNISTARNNFIHRLVENFQQENLGFTNKEFPPEKSIYYALLKNTGIHKAGRLGIHYFDEPNENSGLNSLWKVSNEFLASATVSKKSITDFVNILSEKPFKLKGGFIEYWIPTFLFIKKEEIALYHEDAYIPHFNAEILEVLLKDASSYRIKTFAIEGIKLELFNKYRILIQQDEKEEVAHSTFLDTVKPFVKFYRDLPQYTKQTNRLSEDAKAFRSVIQNAKELEKVFFDDLPTSFGLSLNSLVSSTEHLSTYITRLRAAIDELKRAYYHLIGRIEENLTEELGFSKEFEIYKPEIDKRYKTLKAYLLTPQQKTFRARLISPLDNREKYFNSLSMAIVRKSLEKITDNDEPLLHKKLIQSIRELDNLIEMSNLELDEGFQAINVNIHRLGEEVLNDKIILSPQQQETVQFYVEKVKKEIVFNQDAKVNIAAFISSLEDTITNNN